VSGGVGVSSAFCWTSDWCVATLNDRIVVRLTYCSCDISMIVGLEYDFVLQRKSARNWFNCRVSSKQHSVKGVRW
jgi:hypothetical protein